MLPTGAHTPLWLPVLSTGVTLHSKHYISTKR